MTAPSHNLVLYDGVCALCNWTVRVVLRLDRAGRVRFAPLGGEYAAHALERHPEARDVDSLILVEPGDAEGALVKSDAVLRLAYHLGGAWRASAVLWLVPRPVRDWVYDRVARHRYRLFGRLARRPDPPGRQRGPQYVVVLAPAPQTAMAMPPQQASSPRAVKM